MYLARFQLDVVSDGNGLAGADAGGAAAGGGLQDSGTMVLGAEDGDSDLQQPAAPQRRQTQKRTAPRKGWEPY